MTAPPICTRAGAAYMAAGRGREIRRPASLDRGVKISTRKSTMNGMLAGSPASAALDVTTYLVATEAAIPTTRPPI